MKQVLVCWLTQSSSPCKGFRIATHRCSKWEHSEICKSSVPDVRYYFCKKSDATDTAQPFGLICLALRVCTNWMTPGSPSLDGCPRPKHTYGHGSDFFTPASWIIIKWKLTLWPWPWEHRFFLTNLSYPDSAKQAVRTGVRVLPQRHLDEMRG